MRKTKKTEGRINRVRRQRWRDGNRKSKKEKFNPRSD